MVLNLGATFLRCALGPLSYAGGCILANRVADGLRELAIDSLEGGFRRGITETAKGAGVRVQDVEHLLPMVEIKAAVHRLSLSQPRVVTAWAMHAGQIGGLLKGVAELTVDGRLPDVSMFLDRLAKKVSRDPQLAEPLQTLSDDIANWQDLIERCGDLLGDGGTLAKAYRRRRLMWMGTGFALVLALGGAVAVGFWVYAARARVSAVIASGDPCAVNAIDPSDRDRVGSAQREQLDELRATCAAKLAREEQARQEERLREALLQAKERERREREARCAELASHVDAGELKPEDEALAAAAAPLLGRIARGKLDAVDYGPTEAALPCGDTPGGAKITAAFGRALLASPLAWVYADDLSKGVQAILVARSALLSPQSKMTLTRRAEEEARSALFSGNPLKITRATKLCRLKEALSLQGGEACKGLLAIIPKEF